MGAASNGKGGVLEEKRAGVRWLLPVVLSCAALVVPLVSLHQKPEAGRRSSVDAASPSSFELAARLGHPLRASRSAPRSTASTVLIASDPVPTSTTTTTVYVAATSVTVRRTTPTTHASTTHTTTKKKSTTTTTRRKSTTTTTRKPAPQSPPTLRPFTAPTQTENSGQSEAGEGTWYKTSDPVTCAHKTIPMGTIVKVTNIENGKSTTCKVQDRGPYVEGRIIDMSPEVFSQIATLSEGVINVKIEW